MKFEDIIKSYINKIYRKDSFTNKYLKAIGSELDNTKTNIADFESQLFFDTATDYGLRLYERDLGMININTLISERRQNVQANWVAVRGKKFKLSDIQNICNAWENGRVTVDFINGVIVLTFNDIYGRPSNLDKLLETIENIKPAHLPLKCNIRYHTYGEVKKKTCNFFEGKTYKYIREGNWK